MVRALVIKNVAAKLVLYWRVVVYDSDFFFLYRITVCVSINLKDHALYPGCPSQRSCIFFFCKTKEPKSIVGLLGQMLSNRESTEVHQPTQVIFSQNSQIGRAHV